MARKKAPPKQVENIKNARFTDHQRYLIIQWLAEGLSIAEINAKAAEEKPPFIVTNSEAHYYRFTRQIDVARARKDRESEVMNTGFALRENRVAALNKIAVKFFSELTEEDRLWLTMVKGIGSGPDYERIEYEEFNKAEFDAFRAALADLAEELGARIRRHDLTSGDKPMQTGLDIRLWKNLTSDELELLEQAAEIIEKYRGGDQPAPDEDGDTG